MKIQEQTIQGVRCAVANGHYYFSLRDLSNRLGFKSFREAERQCDDLDNSIKLSDGRIAISLDDLIRLSKVSPELPDDFINALQEEVAKSQQGSVMNGLMDTPNFSNPAEVARAWAELYEQQEVLKNKLENALEQLGDGKEYKIVRAIPWLGEYFNLNLQYLIPIIGCWLARFSRYNDIPIRQCMAFGYRKGTTIGMYSVIAIDKFRENLESDETFMASYRKKAKA